MVMSNDDGNTVHRRDILRGAMGLGVATVLPALGAAKAAPARDLIRKENEQAGTRDWMLSKTRIDPATKYRCPWIEGYCSATSVRAGEKLSIHVSTRPASSFTIHIYRMGYYGGTGGRHVLEIGPFQGKAAADPPVGSRRLRECGWEPSATIKIPADWPSGVYLGKLTSETEGLQSYVIFIVRDDRPADFIFQCSDTTWQAYNRWPSQFALYDDGANQWYWGPGVDVTFDRPYGKYCQIVDAPLSTGSGEWFLWEFPLAYWMESRGYDVTYISNLDTHRDPDGLLRARGFLSVGHDEYYSLQMYDNLRGSIQKGLNVAFLSGNTCCGVIDLKDSSAGRSERIFSRVDRYGPPDPVEINCFSGMEKLPFRSPNENTLVGARSVCPVTGGADWICARPEHWIFAGTDMKKGDGIAGLVGWEWHGDPAKIPGLEVVATGPTNSGKGDGTYTATVYPGPTGNFVFNASSCWWADGLAAPPGYVRPSVYTSPQGPDPRARRITANVLERMRQVGRSPKKG